ncbi:MAG: circularly permuted type 2 ATP-grasp protein, partial [Betaproteobacteria bacterium]|nr:circularly permuted type 2 ATP-grasp protein [Betaproteobacteria bacterium]
MDHKTSVAKPAFYNDMYQADGLVRAHYAAYAEWLEDKPVEYLLQKQREADTLYTRLGITFAVYGDETGVERAIPFDIIPRIFDAAAWSKIHDGACQRVRALNAFLRDIYHNQNIVRAGIVPAEYVMGNSLYRPEMRDFAVPGDVYVQVAGVDVVQTGSDEFSVLEDNLRTPSGVSYMLENRNMMMRLFPELFARMSVAPIDHYTNLLLENLRSVSPGGRTDPVVVVLTPGPYNSAYFEHAFLAQQMGVELVEGQDLFVADQHVYLRTTRGPQRVDVIYRRIDDDFLDPLAFRPDSVLGVAGLFAAYRAGNVTLANAIGTGLADDKSTYIYVPEMIRFYLGEEPILQNVPTWQLRKPDDLKHVLSRLSELVVKEVQGSG